MERIYLDTAATCKPYPEVAKTVIDTMMNHYGNASSVHSTGKDAMKIIEEARELIADDINCSPDEIIFTSGACEANSLAYTANKSDTLITSRMEHKSVVLANKHIGKILYVQNDSHGRIIIDSLKDILSNIGTNIIPFVSIQAANNEIGVIQDIYEIGNLVRQYNGIFHTDATQLYPYQKIDVQKNNIQMMSVSAQKFCGPKGAGFLYVRNEFGEQLSPVIYGSQENGLRGGTYNTPLIAGMATALRRTRENQSILNRSIQLNRDYILNILLHIDNVWINGPSNSEKRLVNNISALVNGCRADQLVTIADLYGIDISAGSACDNGSLFPSQTLKAICLTDEEALSTIRITVGSDLTLEQLQRCEKLLPKIVQRARSM